MSSQILINVWPNQTRVAYIENGQLSDLKIERRTAPTMVGSVYKGKVLRVLPGMQAAFVDIGLDRAAFLYVGDVRDENEEDTSVFLSEEARESDEAAVLEGSAQGRESGDKRLIQDLLREGQTILVQVAKDPLGTKGARITTHVSLPGRCLVYMPTSNHVGVSRRIEDEKEKERLRCLVEKLKPQGGVIVRTLGEGSEEEELQADLQYLQRRWREVERNYEKKKKPGLIYSEMDVELRSLRDMLNEQVEKVIVDDLEVFKKMSTFISQFLPAFKNKIELYDQSQPLFDRYEIDLEISRSMERKVWLKSGGYIVFDEAEALVVIDVNTGGFVGKKDLEDTILKTNLEAVREVTHQLKIRNCGGIIIIDFIDMEKESHREMVLTQLEDDLAIDRARTEVVSMSDLGLVEMTRKRIRPSLVSTLCEPCPYCDGKGYIKRKQTVINEIFRSLEREALAVPEKASLVVHCHADVADWAYEEESETLEFIEKRVARPLVFKIEPSFHVEQYEIGSV